MKKFSILLAIVLVLQFVLPLSNIAQAEDESKSLYYVALGDSLAAGMNENGKIGFGYADLLAKNYQEQKGQVEFNKGFSYPGYTTVDVLKGIEENVTKPIYDLNGVSEKTLTIREAVQQADLITLSVGANDLLKNVDRSESGEFSFDTSAVIKSIQEVAVNYKKIFDNIYKINPEVDIIVMGLYNPFPYVEDAEIQKQLNMLVTTLNNSMKNIVESNGGVFTEVAAQIATDAKIYLPNPKNIHLSEAGYQVVADAMMKDYLNALIKESEEDITEDEIVKAPFTDIQDHWSKEYIDVAYAKGIINGYEDGTFQPNADMTRAQVISVISRAFGLTATNKAPFKDISHYAQQTQSEIAAAYEAGLIKENNGYFNPQDKITRSQLALILMRLSTTHTGQLYEPAKLAPFQDIANFDREAQLAITFLYDTGVVQGTSAATFSPKGNVTRAQVAKILVLATN
ncbi:S-layer homology domain-containing protein [Solibacillus sp. FSL W7-1464]|uniref:S-layer homology domain-containing protein n=1 Tax=Solibacillus sp. FSL W7-1464 TaxID=2921706 RepID=UPI0030F50767